MKALPSDIRDCRVDALVERKVLIDKWEDQGSKKSLELTRVTRELLFVLSSRNVQISLTMYYQGKTLQMALHGAFLAWIPVGVILAPSTRGYMQVTLPLSFVGLKGFTVLILLGVYGFII